MNSLEIAARNYLANTLGASEAIIDLMMQDDELSKQSHELVAAMLTGPYGTLVPTTEFVTATLESTDEVEGFLDGYTKALNDTIEHIDNSVIGVPCECAASAVHCVLDALKHDIQTRIDEIDAGTNEDPTLAPLDLTALASLLFGDDETGLESSEG